MSGKPSDADKRGAAAGIALQGGSTATPAVLPPSPARSSKYVEPFASTVLDAARIADPANHGRYSAELARASVYSVRASADGGGGGGTGSALADAAAAAPPSASAAPPPPPPGPVTKALLRLFKGTRLGRELKELGFRGWLRSQLVTIILVATCVAGLLALQQTGWRDLPVDAWWTVWSVFIAMVLMVRGDADPDICLFLTNTILLLRGVVQPNDVFSGFANVSIVTIALMMAVATGLESAGVLDYVPTLVLGSSRYIWLAQLRMWVMVAVSSAFMNNTPLVAVMIPVIEKWCRAHKLPPSRFMMPLSYAAIVGGLCTMIGTSTNLVVAGLARPDYPDISFPFFEIGLVGAPLVAIAGVYVLLFSRVLLPVRQGIYEAVAKDPREYALSLRVGPRSSFVGKTVEAAGLRHLSGLFLVDVERRDGHVVGSPGPEVEVMEGDVLTFAGDISSVHTLLMTSDLQPVGALDFSERSNFDDGRRLVEAVIALHSPAVNLTVREAGFRTRYGASILAVHRFGTRVAGKIGDIVLLGGDTVLLETTAKFVECYKHSTDFALVSDSYSLEKPQRNWPKLLWAAALFVAMIVVNSLDLLDLSVTALSVLYAYFITGVMSVDAFRGSIPGKIMLTVSGAFGIAKAMTDTGVAARLGSGLVAAFRWMGPVLGPMTAVYLATAILTALLSNGATVAIVYPIARSVASSTSIPIKPLLYLMMLGGSSDFSTPIGYQTNLMVSGPGGYTFTDYTRFGLPLQAVTLVTCVGISYAAWGRGGGGEAPP